MRFRVGGALSLRRSLPYALSLVAVSGALLLIFRTELALLPWRRVIAYVAARGEHFVFGPAGRMLAMIAALMAVELFFLEWQLTSIYRLFVRRSASAKTDLAWTIAYFTHFSSFVETALTLGLAYGFATLSGIAFARLGWMHLQIPIQGPLGTIATFVVFFLLSTFSSYWLHRLQHWRSFWLLHRYHHAATELNILTGLRNNPVEALTNALSVPMPLLFLRVDDWTIAATVITFQTLSTLQHSELRWDFGWFGRWIMVSPRMHQIHHSIDPEHQDKNFSVFPLWDHLFGTWYGGPNLPSAYGIADPAHVERPGSQWMRDIWSFYRDALQGIAGMFGRHSQSSPSGVPSP